MLGFFKKAGDFIRQPTHGRTAAFFLLLLLAIAIPLTVTLSQKQQEIRQRASEGTGCPDLCYAEELWIGIPRLTDGTCDNSHPQDVFKCPGEKNTITCNKQAWYCAGYWTPGVRPQAPTATSTTQPTGQDAAPTPTSTPIPTVAPTPTGGGTQPPAQLQTCTPPGEFGFCGNSQKQFPQGQQVSCGTGTLARISSGDSACTNRQYPLCYVCPNPTQAPSAPTAAPVDQLRLRSANPISTPTSAPRGVQPTAIPTPTGTRIAGDIDGSGSVDTIDYSILISCFGANANLPSCGTNKTKADLNNDGKIDGIDYNILIRNFGR